MKRKVSQVESLFVFDTEESRWQTNGIFSDHFLRNRLPSSEYWPNNDRVELLYKKFSELWRKRYIGLGNGNEETTRREFLEHLLDNLGFSYFSNLSLPVSNRAQTPDYLLFQDGETKDRVFNESLETKHQSAIGLLEAKKVNHPLDQISRKETPGRFPHQQIRDYLTSASDNDGNPYFRWGILSNGNKWRLYCRDSHPAQYFEFHLAGPEQEFCKIEDFKIFLALFQPQVFILKEGKCTLDEIRDQAIVFQTKLEEDLRERIFRVVADLANGFWSFKDNKLEEKDLPTLYDNCLIFLYRLLFILYAEGRGLLPVKPSGAGSNRYYRERFSLQRFIPKLKRGIEFQSNELTDLYEELLKLFHLINGDKPALNRECNVPHYNGGLFNPKNHTKLEEWRVSEKALAQVLRDLIFSSGYKELTKQPGFNFGTIDYADLEVRQLGDIYEGLLGGHLELIDNVLEPRSERGALQVSGTFYTPDWVVRFLIEKTLKPLIVEIENKEEVKLAVKKNKKDNSFAINILRLNILDNAMGSGHFLVRATEWLADQIVYHPTTKFQIESVPPGISQEQAEISYWRRRVVEACIYGVDFNPLAVELTKLSLWLTCIAVNEPLNFLDHHLRMGNSLIGAQVHELTALPIHQEQQQIGFTFGSSLSEAISGAIKEIEVIEQEDSNEIDVVKKKEERWRDKIVKRLQPFQRIADLWTSASLGLELNESEYISLAQGFMDIYNSKNAGAKKFEELLGKYKSKVELININVHPFHWELEFPDVFYEETGKRKVNPGFDAILGNPPYISTQTSSGFDYRPALTYRFGFVDDLYVHFTFQGFNLLRIGGMFGYIVSDTFFTIGTKLPMRKLLQAKRLHYLGQCDPFDATVDASIFVAENEDNNSDYPVDFIQARYATEHSTPEKELSELAIAYPKLVNGGEKIFVKDKPYTVFHGSQKCLRLHRIGIEAYRKAIKQVFFEPKETNIILYNRLLVKLKKLNEQWWEKIETSSKFDKFRDRIIKYQESLKPGDITFVGLIAEGAQGLGTGNNGKYLGFLEGSGSALEAEQRRKELTELWSTSAKYKSTYGELQKEYNLDFDSIAEQMKKKFSSSRESWLGQNVGFKRGEVYRIVKKEQVFDTDNIQEAERSVTVYEGLESRRSWILYSKGDKEGNKWANPLELYIHWSKENVKELQTIPTARWQGHKYFMKSGVTWTDTGNHVALKARIAPNSIFDVTGMRLNPNILSISAHTLLAVMNSSLFSYFIKKYIDHTQKYQINDIRQAPIVIPTIEQVKYLDTLGKRAVEAKELILKKLDPYPSLINYSRELARKQQSAPKYLQPPPQLLLLDSSEGCLDAIELAVQWEVEKLYGVEGMGPFDEF